MPMSMLGAAMMSKRAKAGGTAAKLRLDVGNRDEEGRPRPKGFGSIEEMQSKAKETNKILATETVDRIFGRSKMKIECPPRWRTLFLAAAKRLESKYDALREELFIAVAMDDRESMRRIEKAAPDVLFRWWAYDLGLVARARDRKRPELLEALPPLYGQAYPTIAKAKEMLAAMAESGPSRGSVAEIVGQQRSLILCSIVRPALAKRTEINVEEMRQRLAEPQSGNWQETFKAAVGVNFSPLTDEHDFIGWRVLHFVAACAQAVNTAGDAAAMLLDAKADARLQDVSGCTALHTAAMRNNVSVVEILLERGAPVEIVDLAGITPPLAAARSRNAAILRRMAEWVLPKDASVEMLQAEPEIHSQRFNPVRGFQLHEQVAAGDREKVVELVQVGNGVGGDLADVNFVDARGRTPMHLAVLSVSDDSRAADMVRCLVALKGDVDYRDYDGDAPIHHAVRGGRSLVVRALCRLKAHPGMPNAVGYTPLMLASTDQGAAPQPPQYDGSLVNRPFDWHDVEGILRWHGADHISDPPWPKSAPPMRKHSTKLPEGKAKKGKSRPEPAEKMDKTKKPLTPAEKDAIFDRAESARARGDVLAMLGFDDQWIVDEGGKANRGDRIQLFRSCWAWDQSLGRQRPVVDNMRLLWKSLTAPLLRQKIQGILPPRLDDLLRYLLMTALGGKRGDTFGVLISTNVGTMLQSVPLRSWDEFVEAMGESDLKDRAREVCRLAFRKPLPGFTSWVGAAWAFDEYPRDANNAPWGAFEYVDRNNAPKLNSFNVNKSEAFQDCMFPFQEKDPDLPTGSKLLAHRSDQWRLGERLFVDEATGLRELVHDRVQLMGNSLLCPLLNECAKRLAKERAPDEGSAERIELLQYITNQMLGPNSMKRSDLESHFTQAWGKARHQASQALIGGTVPEALATLTVEPDVLFSNHGKDQVGPCEETPPPFQSQLLPESLTHSYKLRHSARAFIMLRQCEAITNADDFNKLVCDISAKFPGAFEEQFWRAAFFLLLWGRGRRLLQAMEKEVKRHLPEGAELESIRLRPRSDILLADTTAVDAWRSDTLMASKLQTTGADASFPSGYGDVLRAEVVCESPEVLIETFNYLARPAQEKVRYADEVDSDEEEEEKLDDDAGSEDQEKNLNSREAVSLKVVRVINDFHAASHGHAFPRASGVLLIAVMKVAPRIRGAKVEQLVEIDLLLPHTNAARWLAEYLGLRPDSKEAELAAKISGADTTF